MCEQIKHYKQVETYIKENWTHTVKPAYADDGTLIGLPKPYTTPCISGMFQELYYWDTYFTNVGLILSGMVEQAKNNVEDMLFLVRTYGKMPNGNRTYYLNRSQPPFLSQMVREVFEATDDLDWLRNEAYPALMTEYTFWQEQRLTPIGLNRYYTDTTNEEALAEVAEYFSSRIGQPLPDDRATRIAWGESMMSLAESGWDCTSRFAFHAHKHAPADLNSLLYLLETNMAYFAELLSKADDAALWTQRAKERTAKMHTHLWSNERQVFCDLNTETGKLNNVVSVAAFYPLFAGLATPEQAAKTVRALDVLEYDHGIACCEDRKDLLSLQWDFPHGWACLHYIVVKGLLHYGFTEDALRIAKKYIDTAASNFETGGNLWEKYNVVTGGVSETKEYETPPMMGWSAGVFLYCEKLLEEYKHI